MSLIILFLEIGKQTNFLFAHFVTPPHALLMVHKVDVDSQTVRKCGKGAYCILHGHHFVHIVFRP